MKAEDWIKVEDRLPEVGQLVLCASHQYQSWMMPAYVLRYSGKENISEEKDEEIWINRWIDEREQDTGYITHWMPLVLPKEK